MTPERCDEVSNRLSTSLCLHRSESRAHLRRVGVVDTSGDSNGANCHTSSAPKLSKDLGGEKLV